MRRATDRPLGVALARLVVLLGLAVVRDGRVRSLRVAVGDLDRVGQERIEPPPVAKERVRRSLSIRQPGLRPSARC